MASTILANIDRWSAGNLEKLRANKKRISTDATIQKHVAIMERLAHENNNVVPRFTWLKANGYFPNYQVMIDNPIAFAHLRTAEEQSLEIYQPKNSGVGSSVVLPPKQFHTLAEYEIHGARFNPNGDDDRRGTWR